VPTAGKRDLEDIIFGTTRQHDLSSRVTRGDYVVDLGKVAEAMSTPEQGGIRSVQRASMASATFPKSTT